MHTASKRKNNLPLATEWIEDLDAYDDFYDDYSWLNYCCGNYPCICYNNELTDIHRITAEAYANRIINDCMIGVDIKNFIVEDRLMHYTSYYGSKYEQDFKDDLAFAWKNLQDTEYGPIIFAKIFGAKDET